jgi:hypothetical protein
VYIQLGFESAFARLDVINREDNTGEALGHIYGGHKIGRSLNGQGGLHFDPDWQANHNGFFIFH